MLKIKAQINIMLPLCSFFQYFRCGYAFKVCAYKRKQCCCLNCCIWPIRFFMGFLTNFYEWVFLNRTMTYFLHLLEKQGALHLPVFFTFFISTAFPEYRGIQRKTNFTDHRTADTMQLFVAVKGNFSGLFFPEQVAAKVNFPETN